jgi:tetratricopeptide (TPR) repeat protein
VKAVVKEFPELIARIKFDQEKRQQGRIYEALPISIFDPKIIHEKLTTDLQGNLVHSQLLINCLLRMRANVNDKDGLISIIKQIYKKNKTELKIIDEFEQTYTPELAIWWYTRDSFLSRLLNKALRTQNIDVLFLFQFFIVDIRKQLEKLRRTSRIIAYRSHLMSRDELNKLRNARGQYISINSFLSATMKADRALSYFEKSDDLERVLFEIDADPRLNKDKPFANIKSYSYNKEEEEVLFMLGSIFEIVKITRSPEGVSTVQLKLSADDSQQLDPNDDNNKLLLFGHVLMTTGKMEEAEIYYRRLLDELPPDHPHLARCYEALGAVADEKGEFNASLQLYEHALEINTKILDKQHPDIASNYNSIGEVYRKKGDHKKAFEYYNKALDILGEKPVGKSLAKKAVCLNNIGIIYQEQQKYKEALDYYTQAFEIRKTYFPSDETSLGMSNNNIGNAHYFLGHFEDALFYYREALKIYKKTLPPKHLKFASTYNNIGAIYDNQGKSDEALVYYRDAVKIYMNMYSPSHPNVIKIEENIQRILAKNKK